MHEVSLARSLLEQVIEIQRQHPLTRIADVEIELGEMSGVEPVLLRTAFQRLVADKGLDNLDLVMNEVPLRAICLDCLQECDIHHFNFVCSHCQSAKMKISQGDCVRLMSINLVPIE